LSGEEKASAYPDTPAGWAKRWNVEFAAARKELDKFREQGVKVDKVYRDERDSTDSTEVRWNLYTSTVQTIEALLFGNTPKVDVARRYADPDDDVARIAGELLERNLNGDFEEGDSSEAAVLECALQDRLHPGLACARVRYEAEFGMLPGTPAKMGPPQLAPDGVTQVPGPVLAPAVPATEGKTYECVETDYVHWQDFLYSPARVWSEVRWVAFRNPLTREQLLARFGDAAKDVPLNTVTERSRAEQGKTVDPWGRADVWEIWLKEDYTPAAAEASEAVEDTEEDTEAPQPEEVPGRVFWYVEGYPTTLEDKPDPLGLKGFWPCPRPMFANITTSKLVPRADYVLAQDQYTEINSVSTRIDWLQKAIKVVGTYDKSSPEVRRLLDEATQNTLIPVDNWSNFLSKGGVQGAVQFLPIDMLVAALMQLRDYRRELVDMLYQATGQSDIMRAQATQAGATATEQRIKTKFGSARLDKLQKEFARFASDIQRLKAEVICKHFEPKTILEKANAQFAFTKEEQPLLPQAVELLKSQLACYRIEVKSESVSMQDMGELKAERTEVLASLSQFFTSVMPAAQAIGPTAMPFMLKLLQANLATVRGASTMEGIIDGAISQLEQQQQQAAAQPKPPPPPDPKVQQAQLKLQGDQLKSQADMQKEQFKHQAELERIQAETVAHDQMEQSQARWGTKEAMDKALIQHATKPAVVPAAPKPGGFLP
jgi:hypothetical protein